MPVARPRVNHWRDDGWLHRQRTHRGTVARLAIAAGYDVVLSNSRGPQNLKDLVEELGPQARAATPAGAAAAGDLVVVSIPPRASRRYRWSRWRQAGPGHHQLHRAARRTDTRTRWLAVQQRGAPAASGYGARGSKVFSNITFWHLASLARAAGAADRRPCRSPGTTRPRRRR